MFEAFTWYENKKQGLGEEFLTSVGNALQVIQRNPAAYRIRYKGKVRAILVDRFPYLVLYALDNRDIKVISVFNMSRSPEVWKKRIKG